MRGAIEKLKNIGTKISKSQEDLRLNFSEELNNASSRRIRAVLTQIDNLLRDINAL